jgi:hypothetical protein
MKSSCDSEISRTAILKIIKSRCDIISRCANGESFFPVDMDDIPKDELDRISLELAAIIDRLMDR